MEIRSISTKIFRAAPKLSEKASHQTNPFGVNFKGNIITADVFSKAAPQGSDLVGRVLNRSKMLTSAIVGSINSVNSSMSSRLNSIVSFGRRMKENVSNAWTLAKNIEIHVDMPNMINSMKERISARREYSVERLSRCSVDDLATRFEDELKVLALGV